MAGGELNGRVALVTGGGRGIGRAAAEALARAGAQVLLTSRTESEGEGTAASIRESGGHALYVRADQASDADWSRVGATLAERFGRLDVLVLCAGVSVHSPIADATVEHFDDVNAINLKGVFLGLKHGVEAIRRTGEGGSVILVGSIVGKIGTPGFGAYAASKDGVRLLAKAAALELGPEGIRVNSLHPGLIDTEMNARFDKAALEKIIPLRRFGRAEEMGDAVLFLASERSKFMTGAELVADAGWIVQ